jgi:hypothetical protein
MLAIRAQRIPARILLHASCSSPRILHRRSSICVQSRCQPSWQRIATDSWACLFSGLAFSLLVVSLANRKCVRVRGSTIVWGEIRSMLTYTERQGESSRHFAISMFRRAQRVQYDITRHGSDSDNCRRTCRPKSRRAWLADEITRRLHRRLTCASVNCTVSFLFPPCSDSRMGSTPFPLFPRVILAPVFSGAYSGPTTLFHKIKNNRLCSTNSS